MAGFLLSDILSEMYDEKILRSLGFEKWITVITESNAYRIALKIMKEGIAKGVYLHKKAGSVEVWYVPKRKDESK